MNYLSDQVIGLKRPQGLSYIDKQFRYQHLYILGKSGTGKSTLIHNLALNDIKKGKAVVVIDPSGDLALDIYRTSPEEVLYFSTNSPITHNILQTKTDNKGKLINDFIQLINNVVSTTSSTEELSARMKRLLRKTLLVLLHKPNVSLLDVEKFLTIKEYRMDLLDSLTIQEPEIINYWKRGGEFEKQEKSLRLTIEALLDRIEVFIMDKRVKNLTCGQNEIDFNDIIDNQRVLLVDLGGLEGELRHFVGSLLIHGLQTSVMERDREDRTPLALYVDEFQNYITSGFEKMLSQGRKYLVSLCLAHQNHDQIPSWLLGSILGNVGTTVVFRCGDKEAKRMNAEIGLDDYRDLINLKDYYAYVRIKDTVNHIKTLPAPKPRRMDIPKRDKSMETKFEEEVVKDEIGWSWMRL